MTDAIPQYRYTEAGPTWANAYLWPAIIRLIDSNEFRTRRAFDLGCGNGATANMLADLGFDVTGVDLSQSGIEIARQAYPQCRFEVGSAYDDLAGSYGRFSLVVSLEVIEHCYDPRKVVHTLHDLAEDGGVVMLSTPYHGYLKNSVLAVTGRLETHFTALWDGGHIKFFSIRTLRRLLNEVGFTDIDFIRVGRVPVLAKSMIALARKTS